MNTSKIQNSKGPKKIKGKNHFMEGQLIKTDVNGDTTKFNFVGREEDGFKNLNYMMLWNKELGNALMQTDNPFFKVMGYFFTKINKSTNMVILRSGEIEKLSKEIGCSKATIYKTIGTINKADIIRRISPQTYIFNPKIFVDGTKNTFTISRDFLDTPPHKSILAEKKKMQAVLED